jgi:Flp pilus assembly protein TadG
VRVLDMALMNHRRAGRPTGRRERRASQRGAAIVEFAIVLPFLAMFVMGIFTGGMAFNNKQQITSAARDAARFGATLAEDQCDSPADCGGKTWAELVRSIAVQRSTGTLTASGVCVALVSGPGSAPVPLDAAHTTNGDGSACYADNSADEGLRVQVSVTRGDVLDTVVFRKSLTLQARAIAQFES